MQQDMQENIQETGQQAMQEQVNRAEQAVAVEAGVLNVESAEAEENTDSKTDAMAALAMTVILLLATIFWLQGL